ncbi:MAG: serine hydrolase [Bacteroidota bacterium]
MHKSILSLLIAFLFQGAIAQTGIPIASMNHCDNQVNSFLNQFGIPSATVAIAKDGKLVYMRAFGNADIAGTEATQPYHMFRIASVSKPITSIAIMKLVEEGQLNLNDKVFGANGILSNHAYLGNITVNDNRIYDITVKHLLEHSGGWNRDVSCINGVASPYPWQLSHCDPIGFPLHVTQKYGETNPVREEVLIRFLMEEGVEFDPGTQYAYSNIGYLTLGVIIEQLTGKSYEEYVKSEILDPIGAYDMYIGNNLLAGKREREGEYVGNGYTAPSAYGTGSNVPWEYGGWSLEAMDAHGGWIASARDLVRLLVSVDGFSTKPDILSTSSINSMVTPSPNNANYAKGWSVNQFNNWWHNGALDGTASLWVRSGGGYTWALILNKRIIDNQANAFWSGFDNLPWDCVSQTNTFPTHDLLASPLQNSTDIVFNGQGNDALTVSWTNGNGDARVLIAREDEAVDRFPLDGTNYLPNSAFGQGDDLGAGNYVVYNGSGNSINLSNLDPNKTYHFRLFDYNQNNTTGNHALYQLARSPQESATTASYTNIENLQQLGLSFYPNPAHSQIFISVENPQVSDRVELLNLTAQVVKSSSLSTGLNPLDIKYLTAGIYLLRFWKGDQYIGGDRLIVE